MFRTLQRAMPNPLFMPGSKEFYYSKSGDRFYLSRQRLEAQSAKRVAS